MSLCGWWVVERPSTRTAGSALLSGPTPSGPGGDVLLLSQGGLVGDLRQTDDTAAGVGRLG
ncbi:hypothetical protein ACKI1O_07840 [Streptomyces scabiei]